MALKTFVKVGSITNLTDARYCAGMGVDLLGFQVVEGQAHYIASKAFQEIRGWVTGPLVVAEIYGLTNAEMLASLLENYRPDYLEMGIAEWKLLTGKIDLPVILSLQPGEEVPALIQPAFVISKTAGESFDCLFPAGNTQQAEAALHHNSIKGLALAGSAESKPGIKEYNELSEILEMLETDD